MRSLQTPPALSRRPEIHQGKIVSTVPIVIVGCTASGKSDLAEALAEKFGATLMAVDSMQVYRGMDIGTAKPSIETRHRIPHLMIDVADPWESYSAARFAAEARPHLEKSVLSPQSSSLILIGGTIFYLRALLEGLFEGPSADPAIRAELETEAARIGSPALHARLATIDPVAATRIHANDLRRIVRALEVHRITGTPITELQTQWNREHPAINARIIGIRREKESLNRRINARVKAMIDAGLLEEVRRLACDPRGFSEEAASAVGYSQFLEHFAGKRTFDEAVEEIKIQTRHLAKMQRTWLKRFPNITWLDADDNQSGSELLSRACDIIKE
jgi:tRNA dimethylallyltransferase